MSRLCNGTSSDFITATLTAGIALNATLTQLIVVRIMDANDGTWLSLLEGKTSGGAPACALGRRNVGDTYWANTAGTSSANTIGDGDNWMILALTKATGSTLPAHHKMPIGGSRTTTNGDTTLANGSSLASGAMRIGGNEDYANIRVAAAAFWDGTALTTGQLDGILSAKTTASINALSPTWLVDDSNAFATNLANPGVMDPTLTGTSDDADDPSGWVYGLAGGTDYTGTVPAAALATASGPAVTASSRPYVNISVS